MANRICCHGVQDPVVNTVLYQGQGGGTELQNTSVELSYVEVRAYNGRKPIMLMCSYGVPILISRPVARILFGGGGGGGGGVRSLERKGYFCQRFSVAVKSIYNQLRHDNSLLL